MKKEAKVLLGLVFVVLVGVLIANKVYDNDSDAPAAKTTQSGSASNYGQSLRQEYVREDSYTKGPKTAKVTLVEFLDPECEACKAFYPIIKQILSSYEGGIHFVVRYMALHTSSAMAIAATESAGLQGKYWEMQDLLFNLAEEWGHKEKPDPTYFIKYAGTLGLDVEKFKTDLNDPRWATKISRDMADGKTLGVQGTPTIFIDGEKLKNLNPEELRRNIETALRAQ